MGMTASERRARIIFMLDLILAATPITFYIIILLILSVLWIFGEYNAPYGVLEWILKDVMFVPTASYATPMNPGQGILKSNKNEHARFIHVIWERDEVKRKLIRWKNVFSPRLVADLRMFFFSVWGISLLYNIIDIFMSFYLLKSMKMRNEDPYLIWMGVRVMIIVTTTVFIIVQLATGFRFLSQLLEILYLIYRCIGFAVVIRRLRAMRDGLEQEISA